MNSNQVEFDHVFINISDPGTNYITFHFIQLFLIQTKSPK